MSGSSQGERHCAERHFLLSAEHRTARVDPANKSAAVKIEGNRHGHSANILGGYDGAAKAARDNVVGRQIQLTAYPTAIPLKTAVHEALRLIVLALNVFL